MRVAVLSDIHGNMDAFEQDFGARCDVLAVCDGIA
jgi:predicted phosphodiesterase